MPPVPPSTAFTGVFPDIEHSQRSGGHEPAGAKVKFTRRVAVTVETHEVTVLRRHRAPVRSWCEECRATVLMVSPDEAAGSAGVSSRTVFRWIEAGRLHFTETAKGTVMVCANSIPKPPLPLPKAKPRLMGD